MLNHKKFFKELDKKNMFDLENLIIETEQPYTLKDHRDGEIDRAYINLNKKYAYVIEYKNSLTPKTYYKATEQCCRDIKYINEKYHIPKHRIFCFTAFGKGEKDYVIFYENCKDTK